MDNVLSQDSMLPYIVLTIAMAAMFAGIIRLQRPAKKRGTLLGEKLPIEHLLRRRK
jgi:hypothetical protein